MRAHLLCLLDTCTEARIIAILPLVVIGNVWCTGVWHLPITDFCTSLPPSVACCDLSLSLFTLPRPCDVCVESSTFTSNWCNECCSAAVSAVSALTAGLSSQLLQSASEASMTIDKNMMAKNEMPDEEQQSVGRRLLMPRMPRIHGQSVFNENQQCNQQWICQGMSISKYEIHFAQLDLVNDLLPAEEV